MIEPTRIAALIFTTGILALSTRATAQMDMDLSPGDAAERRQQVDITARRLRRALVKGMQRKAMP